MWQAPLRIARRIGPDKLIVLAICVSTFLAFLPALNNWFVNWDDDHNFLENLHYRGLGWTNLHWMFITTFRREMYIPLTWLTLGADYQLWGMDPFGYHLTNLLFHAANASVFYFVAKRLIKLSIPATKYREIGFRAAGAVAALVFALHPLRVESVVWVTERRDVVCGFFYLLTLLAYLKWHDRPTGHPDRQRWDLASLGFFALSLLAKPMAITIPLVMLIIDAYPLRRLGDGSSRWLDASARRVYLEKAPFAFLAGLACAIALPSTTSTLKSMGSLAWPDRIAVALYAPAFYIWKVLLPIGLAPLYELPAHFDPLALPILLGAGFVITTSSLAIALRVRLPWLLAAWAVYLVTLLPVLGLIRNGPHLAADRYTYLACLPLAVLLSGILLRLLESATKVGLLATAGALLAAISGLGFATWHQSATWHDSESLWTHALSTSPSSVAHCNLGATLARQGAIKEAVEHFRAAIMLRPDNTEARYNLGACLGQLGQMPEAFQQIQEALRQDPRCAKAHHDLGALYELERNWPEAIEQYREALKLDSRAVVTHVSLGRVLARSGNSVEAAKYFQAALQIDPNYEEARRGLRALGVINENH